MALEPTTGEQNTMTTEQHAQSGAASRSARTTRRLRRVPAFLATGAVVLAAGTAQAAASPTKSAASKRAPVAISLWESHNGGPVGAAMSALVTKFDKTHRSVKVTIVVTKASTKLLAAIPAGTAPPLAEISHYDGAFRHANLLINQAPLMGEKGGFSRALVASFFPGVLANGRIPQKVVNGKVAPGAQFRLPADVKVSEFFYNTAMFKQAGIASCPATWTALGSDLVKLKKLGVIPMGFKDASAHIEPAFISNGGSLYKPGTHRTATEYDSAAGRTTFNQFRSWYSKKLFVFAHGADMRAAIANKKMAIEDGTSAGWVKARDAAKANGVQVRACAYPAGTSGHSGNIVQGLGFAVFSQTSPAQREAAFDFEQFWNAPKIQAIWAKGSGFDPTVKAAVPLIGKAYLNSGAGAGLKVSIQALKSPYTQPRGQSDNYAEVDSALDSAFFDAVTGKASVVSTLAHLDKVDAGYLKGSTQI